MQTPVTSTPSEAAALGAPTLAERIDAVEDFLQQLVLLLEVEPELNRENIAAWLEIVGASARSHGLQSPRERFATERLCARVLCPPVALERPAA